MLGACPPKCLILHITPHSQKRKPCCYDILDSVRASLHDFKMPVSQFTHEQNGLAVMTPSQGQCVHGEGEWLWMLQTNDALYHFTKICWGPLCALGEIQSWLRPSFCLPFLSSASYRNPDITIWELFCFYQTFFCSLHVPGIVLKSL